LEEQREEDEAPEVVEVQEESFISRVLR